MPDENTSQQDSPQPASPAGGDNLNLISGVGYIGILFLLPLLMFPKNEYAIFHANQGLNILIGSVIGNVILGMIPIFGWLILPFFNIAVLVIIVIGFINAYNGKKKKFPIIGDYSLLKVQS